MGDNSYIMNLKSMMFRHPSQKHFKFVIDFSYTLVVGCCEVWFKFLLWRVCVCVFGVKGHRRVVYVL